MSDQVVIPSGGDATDLLKRHKKLAKGLDAIAVPLMGVVPNPASHGGFGTAEHRVASEQFNRWYETLSKLGEEIRAVVAGLEARGSSQPVDATEG